MAALTQTINDAVGNSDKVGSTKYLATTGVAAVENLDGGSAGAAMSSSNTLFTSFKGTGTSTFETTPTPISGGLVGKWADGGDTRRTKFDFSTLDAPLAFARGYFRVNALPAVQVRFLGFETSESVTPPGEDLGTVVLRPTGKLRIRDASGITLETVGAWMSTTQWVRLELKYDRVGGVSTLRVFAGANLHGTTPDEEISTSTVAVSTVGNGLTSLNVGVMTATPLTLYADALAVSVTDWVGPYGTTSTATLYDGALDDFSVSSIGDPDPAITETLVSYPTAAYASTAWGRAYVAATAPIDYVYTAETDVSPASVLWRGAAYASLEATFNNAPPGEFTMVDNIQLERSFKGLNRLPESASVFSDGAPYVPWGESYPTWKGTGGLTLSRVTAASIGVAAKSGSAMMKCLAGTPSGANLGYYPVPYAATAQVTAAENLAGRVWVNSSSATAKFRPVLQFWDANWGALASVNGSWVLPGASTWQALLVTGAAPAGAAFAAVTVEADYTTVVSGNYWLVNDVRLYGTDIGPTAWSPARQTTFRVQADRMNYMKNPECNASQGNRGFLGFGDTGVASTLAVDSTAGNFLFGTQAMKVTVQSSNGTTPSVGGVLVKTPSPSGSGEFGMSPLKPGKVYTASVWVKSTADVTLDASFADYVISQKSKSQIEAAHVGDTDWITGGFTRIYVTFRTSTTGRGWHPVLKASTTRTSNTAVDIWCDGWQVEEGYLPRQYFSANDTSGEYLWEGVANFSRSHYYRSKPLREARLTDIITDSLPVGANFAVEWASPYDDGTTELDIYGRTLGVSGSAWAPVFQGIVSDPTPPPPPPNGGVTWTKVSPVSP